VPSAALLCRRSALASVGGFDPSLTVGEDVDIVWRLIAEGWKVRYAPEAEVLHRPRRTLRGLARQRYGYGTSAPLLERRHAGAAGALQAAPHTLGIWVAAAAGGVPGAMLACGASTGFAATGAADATSAAALARVAANGHLHATRHLARVLVREWLPLLPIACLGSRRARRLVALAFLFDMVGSRNSPARVRDLPLQCALRCVDHVAYSAGLWRAMVAARSPAAAGLRVSRRSRAR
jgi:hypothetical protein